MMAERHEAGRLHERAMAACLALLVLLCALVAVPEHALALKPIVVDPDQDRIEITALRDFAEFYDGRGDSLQVETAPAADGMTGRISVTAKMPGTNPELDGVRADEPDR